ncbi:MAG: hypothetical protein KDC53_12750, partial [Saprospiraceae bacterium]|nr:hypothetical protein [Saprospiraceae bacterium]
MLRSIFLLLCSTWLAGAQTCLPSGITFNTQGSIDSFSINYPGCTHIGGLVYISGPSINNLNGLNSLEQIDGNLVIQLNPQLVKLEGLEGLKSVYSVIISSNASLAGISALNNLQSAFGIGIYSNDVLKKINSFNHLTSLSQSLILSNNTLLDTINGFDSLIHIGIDLNITNCVALKSFNAFFQLQSIG